MGALSLAALNLAAAERPNIVFILADDLGYGDLASYGRPDIRTPRLDRLAREGAKLTAHYANGPECTPTRAALLTGRYQQWVGGLECAIGTGNVGRYDDALRLSNAHELGLPAEEQTLPKLVRKAGYRTGIIGKWHLGFDPKFAPHLQGFDYTFYCAGGEMDYFHYLDPAAYYNLFQDGNPISRDGYFTDLVAEEAMDFLEREKGGPFFLYLPYTVPHAPYQGPGDRLPNPLPLDSRLWKQSQAPPAVYIAMIEHLDESVGRVLDKIEALGLADNTVVIFTSDNGGTKSARNAPFRGIKGGTFEGGIRVPAMVRWPGVIAPGTVSGQVSATFDFSASIARLAGASPSPEKPFEGVDIIDHLAAGKPDFARTLFWRKPRGQTLWKGMREGSLKFVSETNGAETNEYLFDLAADPSEKTDLRGDRPGELARLRGLYEEWEEEVRRNRRGKP
ncbi:MAG: sulfatase-like hydrolase/transferase [Acidobacteria bacterium]|nr:sulfatase-like hydrolase/transferase [Acidobacteriota bacterium]